MEPIHQTEKDNFLLTVKEALGVHAEDNRNIRKIFSKFKNKNPEKLLNRIAGRSMEDQRKLLEMLEHESKPINLNIIPVHNTKEATDRLIELAVEKTPESDQEKQIVAWRHPIVDQLELAEGLSQLSPPITLSHTDAIRNERNFDTEKKKIRTDVINSYIGVTGADFCIAETATLVLRTRPGQVRSVSLVPLIHVAIIDIDQIILNLEELYTILLYPQEEKEEGLTNCMTFITGPSKTADIEGVMVHGAHGPREMFIMVITNE